MNIKKEIRKRQFLASLMILFIVGAILTFVWFSGLSFLFQMIFTIMFVVAGVVDIRVGVKTIERINQ